MSDIIEDGFKVARKDHVCDECGHAIAKGERYHRWAGHNDGSEFMTWKSHADCHAAVQALNKQHEVGFYDEWMGLRDLECEDRDWLCEDFPAVAARLGWSIYDWREPRWYNGAFFGAGSHYFWQAPL
jgi:hypothetical protein